MADETVAHPDDLATAHPRSEMVLAASAVQYCQIHDEPLHPGAGRGIRRTRDRRELPLAPHGDRNRSRAIRARRRGDDVGARKPEIVADAAHAILTLPARPWTGRFFLDDEVLLGAGVSDFGKYDAKPGAPLIVDLFAETLPGMKAFG
jgi:hypothetical protein